MRVDTAFPAADAVTGLLSPHALPGLEPVWTPGGLLGFSGRRCSFPYKAVQALTGPAAVPPPSVRSLGDAKMTTMSLVSAQALCLLLKVVMTFRAQCALEIDLFLTGSLAGELLKIVMSFKVQCALEIDLCLTGSLAGGVRWGLRVNLEVPAL